VACMWREERRRRERERERERKRDVGSLKFF
jgi:hypothetical protein